MVAMLLGDPFGYFGVGLIGGEVWGEWEDMRSQFWQVFTCLEGFLCVRIGEMLLDDSFGP